MASLQIRRATSNKHTCQDIEIATRSRRLLDARQLMRELYSGGVEGEELKSLIRMQVGIARRGEDCKWLRSAAREAEVFVRESLLDTNWVDANIYFVRQVAQTARRPVDFTHAEIRKSLDTSAETFTVGTASGPPVRSFPTVSLPRTASGTSTVDAARGIERPSWNTTIGNPSCCVKYTRDAVEVCVSSPSESEDERPKRQWSWERNAVIATLAGSHQKLDKSSLGPGSQV